MYALFKGACLVMSLNTPNTQCLALVRYDYVDVLVLDSHSSCAPTTSSSSSTRASNSASATCPQSFEAHVALLRWLRPGA